MITFAQISPVIVEPDSELGPGKGMYVLLAFSDDVLGLQDTNFSL